MMTKEESTKTVNYLNLGPGVLVPGRGHTVKMLYFFIFSYLLLDQTN